MKRLARRPFRVAAAWIVGLAVAGIAGDAAAQGGGATSTDVAGADLRAVMPGPGAMKRVLSQRVYNDAGEKVVEANDSFVSPLTVETVLAASALAISVADQSRPPPDEALLSDSLGRIVKVPTAELPQALHPPAAAGVKRQIPSPARGAKVPNEVLRRLEEAREEEFHFFPAVQPRLMPYLASLDEYGNTAIGPGALVPTTPLDSLVQRAKYWLSEHGLRYSLQQTSTFVDMAEVVRGDNAFGYYTVGLLAKWAVFNAPRAGTAGWISTEIEAKTGLGANGQTQSAQSNLDTITEPASFWFSVNGLWVAELAWQQSLRNGEVVVLAGILDQSNYLDWNTYAGNTPGQFINSGLLNTMVMPLPAYNFGVNVQWQPRDEWYAMLGLTVGNASAGSPPWTDFSAKHWSALGEIGYAPDDLFGLGPGIYRIQPFLARAGGPTQGGLCFNIQQQLGRQSPFGYFGRFGFGGADVTAGASAQIGTGFVIQAPLKNAGLFPRSSNDLFSVGFVWSRPSATPHLAVHRNEYVLEATYALQLTPTIKLQPDLQVVWNPAQHRIHARAVVFQLQLDVAW